MRLSRILVTLWCAMILPATPSARADIDLHGKALQVYGELHASVDHFDRGPATTTVPRPDGVELTSNSSNIGFKGTHELHASMHLVWMFESEFDLSGETVGLDARNRYLGLSTLAGSMVIGTHNTPLKEIGSRFTLFGDTIGDRTGILGQAATGDNRFNQRARSMVLYEIKGSGLRGLAIYSPDFSGGTNPDTGENGQHSKLFGISLQLQHAGLNLGVAYEQQMAIEQTAGRDASAYRVGAIFRNGNLQLGGVWESLQDDGYGPEIARQAYGMHASYRVQDVTLAGQFIKARPSAVLDTADGASMSSIGLEYSLSRNAQIYFIYAALSNELSAAYQLARSGHGQAYSPTEPGASVSATSIGLIYRL